VEWGGRLDDFVANEMAGRQAKILTDEQIESLLGFASLTRNPERRIPPHLDLRAALVALHDKTLTIVGPVITSERRGRMTAVSIVNWFAEAFRIAGLEGCSSHSGRRTFITRAARAAHRAGDEQQVGQSQEAISNGIKAGQTEAAVIIRELIESVTVRRQADGVEWGPRRVGIAGSGGGI
jgi:integrase